MCEEDCDEGRDRPERDGGAAEGCGGVVERAGELAIAEKEGGKDGEGAGESEELEPLPLGEEPVVAGFLGGEDGGGFGWSDGLEDGGESEGGEGENRVGEIAVAQARDAEDEDKSEGVRGHEGMEGGCQDQAEGGAEEGVEGAAVVECKGYGEQGKRRRKAARGDVGIHEEERGAGDRKCPEGAEKAEAGELRCFVGDRALQQAMSSVEGEPEAEEVGEEQYPREGEMRVVDEESEYGSEDGEAEVLADEDGVVGEEGGVEGELDAGDVEASVLG